MLEQIALGVYLWRVWLKCGLRAEKHRQRLHFKFDQLDGLIGYGLRFGGY